MQRLYQFDSPEEMKECAESTLEDGRPRAYLSRVGEADYDVGVFADGKTISAGDTMSERDTALIRARAMASVLDKGAIQEGDALAEAASVTLSIKEMTSDQEIRYLQGKKRESGDDTPLIYYTRVSHPVKKGGENVSYYEAGILNGQNSLKLGVFDSRTDARDFAVDFMTAMRPAKASDETNTFIGRIAKITHSFGGEAPRTEQIAMAAKQLYYQDRPLKKIQASINARMHNCDRYFEQTKGGKWSLTDDGRAMVDVSNESIVENWVVKAVMSERSEEAKKITKSEETTDLFLFGEMEPSIEPAPKSEDWRKSQEGRARLRAGMMVAMVEKKVPVDLAAMTFGPRIGDFLVGKTKSIPDEDVAFVGKALEKEVSDLISASVEGSALAANLKAALKSEDMDIETVKKIREESRVYREGDRILRDSIRVADLMEQNPGVAGLLSTPVLEFMEGGAHPGASEITKAVKIMRGAQVAEAQPAGHSDTKKEPLPSVLTIGDDESIADVVHKKYKAMDYSHSLYLQKSGATWDIGVVGPKGFATILASLTEEEAQTRMQGMMKEKGTVREAVELMVGIKTDPSSDLTKIDYRGAGDQKTMLF